MDYVIIRKDLLKDFYEDSLKLDALYNAGVDNWEGWSEVEDISNDYPFEEEIESISNKGLTERFEFDNIYKFI